jgi:hypothetical protein
MMRKRPIEKLVDLPKGIMRFIRNIISPET